MTSSAAKLFKGDLLEHVGPLQARLIEARAILAANPAEFRLARHDVHVDVVKDIMDTIEKEATNIAEVFFFAEFQDIALLLCMLMGRPCATAIYVSC